MQTFFDKIREGSSGEITLTLFLAAIILFAMGVGLGEALESVS